MILRRQPWSLWAFLGFVIVVGAIVGHLWDGLGLAGFLLFISSIDAKPAWKWFYDAPGNQDSGRDGARFLSWRRVLPQSPREQRRMPPLG